MDKLIYLFELDSVRTYNKEIEIGQKKMFEEIVVKGNTVALPFNQLVDSKAFLSALEDPKQYASIVELFKLGRIKISLYKKYRSASQYLMTSIRKCIQNFNQNDEANHNKVSFIFSALPINTKDKVLLKKVYFALRYNDLRTLREMLQERKRHALNANDAIENFEKVIRYVKLAMVLDTYEIPYIKARPDDDNIRTLSGYLKLVFDRYLTQKRELGHKHNVYLTEVEKSNFKDALTKLKVIFDDNFAENPKDIFSIKKSTLLSANLQITKKLSNKTNIFCLKINKQTLDELKKKHQNNKNSDILSQDSRSDWYKLIDKKIRAQKTTPSRSENTISDIADMAFTIIDMCHNFTTKESIAGVYNTLNIPVWTPQETASNNFDDFFENFESRFVDYVRSRKEYLIDDTDHTDDRKVNIPNWKVAVRFIKTNEIKLFNNYFIKKASKIVKTQWEKIFATKSDDTIPEHKLWRKKHLWKNILSRVISMIIYICLWYFVSILLDSVEDLILKCSISKLLTSHGARIVLFGLLGSLVEKTFNLRDLLESLIDVFILIGDCFYYLSYLGISNHWWDKFASKVYFLFSKLKGLLDKFKRKK